MFVGRCVSKLGKQALRSLVQLRGASSETVMSLSGASSPSVVPLRGTTSSALFPALRAASGMFLPALRAPTRPTPTLTLSKHFYWKKASMSTTELLEFFDNVPTIDEDAIEIEKLIGRGGNAQVYKGKLTVEGGEKTEVAIKKLNFPLFVDNVREAQMLTLLADLKGVPNLHGLTPKASLLVMEYCHGETIWDTMTKGQYQRVLEAFVQVCETVQTMHDRHLTHGDIHEKNILVGGDKETVEAKLIDFATSRTQRLPDIDTYKLYDSSQIVLMAETFTCFLDPRNPSTKEFIDNACLRVNDPDVLCPKDVAKACRKLLRSPSFKNWWENP